MSLPAYGTLRTTDTGFVFLSFHFDNIALNKTIEKKESCVQQALAMAAQQLAAMGVTGEEAKGLIQATVTGAVQGTQARLNASKGTMIQVFHADPELMRHGSSVALLLCASCVPAVRKL